MAKRTGAGKTTVRIIEKTGSAKTTLKTGTGSGKGTVKSK